MSWEEIFSGFQRLYAVIYSSSVDFVSKIVPMFREAEIIFGHEKVLSGFDNSLAYQEASIEEIRSYFSEKQQGLLKRIDDNTL